MMVPTLIIPYSHMQECTSQLMKLMVGKVEWSLVTRQLLLLLSTEDAAGISEMVAVTASHCQCCWTASTQLSVTSEKIFCILKNCNTFRAQIVYWGLVLVQSH